MNYMSNVDTLDQVYLRVIKQRKFLLDWLSDKWQEAPDSEDEVAMMIAINELGKEKLIEFDSRWRVRKIV